MMIALFLAVQVVYMLFVARTEVAMRRRKSLDVLEMIWNLLRVQLSQPDEVAFFTLAGKFFDVCKV